MKKILIVGDIMMHDAQHENLLKLKESSDMIHDYANSMFSKDLQELLHSADAAIGNLETLIDHKKPESGFPCFNASIDFLKILSYIGFTDLVVTNNHSKDLTYDSWLTTVQNVEGMGIKTHGATDLLRSLKHIDNLCIRAGSERFNKDFDDEATEKTSSLKYLPIDKSTFINSIKWQTHLFNTNAYDPLVQSEIINYFHCGKEYFHDMGIDQLEMYGIIQQYKSPKDIATIFTHSHVVGTKNVRNDELMKFENSLGNFCSMQKSLDRQLGTIIEYAFDEFTRKLKFVKEYVVETRDIDGHIITDFATK